MKSSDYKVRAGKSIIIDDKIYTEENELPEGFNGAECPKSCELKPSGEDKKKLEADKKALKDERDKNKSDKKDEAKVGAGAQTK